MAVVVPAYNEARLIESTVRSIPAFVDRIIVVDDASQDDTSARARAVNDSRIRVVQLEKNAGVGHAISRGYAEAFREGAEVAVVMAGDGQMDPADLDALIAPVADGSVSYAKGNRLSYPRARRRMPLTRWLGNVVLGWLTRWTTGLAIRDSQCGYTALHRSAAQQLPLESLWPRYGYPNDLLAMLAERDLPVAEITVRPVYGNERSGVRLYHALGVVPYVLVRALARRAKRSARPRPSVTGVELEGAGAQRETR